MHFLTHCFPAQSRIAFLTIQVHGRTDIVENIIFIQLLLTDNSYNLLLPVSHRWYPVLFMVLCVEMVERWTMHLVLCPSSNHCAVFVFSLLHCLLYCLSLSFYIISKWVFSWNSGMYMQLLCTSVRLLRAVCCLYVPGFSFTFGLPNVVK